MSSHSSSQIRHQPQSASEPPRPGSTTTGPAIVNSGSMTPPLDDQPTVISKGLPLGAPLAISSLSPAEMGRVLLGQRLGHYDLLEFVGGGGMGAVFKSHDTMLDRIVAVKVLSKVQSDDEETLRRFKNEAQSAARLDHDNIGRVHYVGEDRGWHYIVFEYIEGVNLRDLVLHGGPLPLRQAVSITLQVADALAHASQRDVVHRDIKPSNVLITPEGRAKLVDMGLARLHQVAQPDQDLTASGVTLGTFDYISPEQARDPRNADVRSDLYSLGCTLYFALSGRPPFPEGTVLQKLLQHQADEPVDARQFRSDLPDELLRILKKLLAKTPQQRYQRPEYLVNDLLALAARYGLEVPPPVASSRLASAPAQAPRWARHLPWAVPLAVLAAVVTFYALFTSETGGNSGPPLIHHPAAHDGAVGPGSAATEDTISASSTARSGESRLSGDGKNADEASKNEMPFRTADSLSPTSLTAKFPSATANSPDVPPDSAPGAPNPLNPTPANGTPPRTADSSAAGTVIQPSKGIAGSVPEAGTPSSGTQPNLGVPASASASEKHDISAPSTSTDQTSNGGDDSSLAPVLVVDPAAASLHSTSVYATLADACRAARNGDLIEVRTNGLLRERPIDLVGLTLSIRAGKGYSPIVSFQPQKVDLSLDRHTMLTLSGSQLTLIGLQIELNLPRDAVSSWSLAEIRPGESLRMEDCAVTVRGSLDSSAMPGPDVAIFDVRPVPDPGMASDDAPVVRPPASLQLKNCILRGEATVVRSDELQPATIEWTDGILATNQWFFSAAGGSSDTKLQGATQLKLQHVTALIKSGFCRLTNSQDDPLQLPLSVEATDCIFICDPTAALLDQSGNDSIDAYRARITWNGQRNFYEGISTFWQISPSGAEVSQMTFAEWVAHWGANEIQPMLDKVAWQRLPNDGKPVDLLVPADFALRSGGNAALHSAPDGSAAGMDPSELPPIGEPETLPSSVRSSSHGTRTGSESP